MKEELKTLIIESTPNQKAVNTLIGRLFDVVHNSSIFGAPVVAGAHTVITASEFTVGMGAGWGGGGGFAPEENTEGAEVGSAGTGGGGGGGGSSMARPVAAIIIGPQGVRVEPIVDPTKIAIAFFTTFFGMMITLANARRFARRAARE